MAGEAETKRLGRRFVGEREARSGYRREAALAEGRLCCAAVTAETWASPSGAGKALQSWPNCGKRVGPPTPSNGQSLDAGIWL